jgi:mannose-1-phosphate guanylyltransferase
MPDSRPWAAILAGGDGRRLKPLTRSMAGDARPKQFCQFFGGRTLLDDTRERLRLNVPDSHHLFVVSRAHEVYYRQELADVPEARLIEQPLNRGTTAAVAATLFRLRAVTSDATVGFFPADHYYRDPAVLQRTVAAAYALTAVYPDRVIVLGAEADRAETEYGWLEPGERVAGAPPGMTNGLRSVLGFWEKPSLPLAEQLLGRGCFWNTLVVIGRMGAFEALLERTVPDVWDEFASRQPGRNTAQQATALRQAYAAVRPSDFSHEVLAAGPDRLSVLALPNAGWTDLGQPLRVLDVLADRKEVLAVKSCAAG